VRKSSRATDSVSSPSFVVLTDHGSPGLFSLYRRVIRLEGVWAALARLFPSAIVLGLKCWFASLAERRPGPFVTIGSAHGFVFAALQFFCGWFAHRRTHVMFDLLLERKRRGLLGLFDAAKMHVFNKAVDLAVVWGTDDIATYSREYSIPPGKLRFHPFHNTLAAYDIEVGDDGYVFAGGNNGRDYQTLIEALRDIDYPVFIATQCEHVRHLAKGLNHIRVEAVTPEEFRKKMARSSFVVEAHPKDFFRTAGHQTFLNAMYLGKPFVMADARSAIGYFEDGEGWFVVDAGDSAALRERIFSLLSDRRLLCDMSIKARKVAAQPLFQADQNMCSLYNIALDVAHTRTCPGTSSPWRIECR